MTSGLSLHNSSLLDCASEHSRNAHDHRPEDYPLLSLPNYQRICCSQKRTWNILWNKACRLLLACLNFISSNSVPHDSLRVRLRGHPFLLCVSSVFPVYSWFQVPSGCVITQVELMRSRDLKVVESMYAHPRWEKTGTPEGKKCSHCCSAGKWCVGTWAGSSREPLCCNFPYELTGGCFCFIFQFFKHLGLPLWKPLLRVQYLAHILPLLGSSLLGPEGSNDTYLAIHFVPNI